jgi:hypothetical protein
MLKNNLSKLVNSLSPTERKFVTSSLLARKTDNPFYLKYFRSLAKGENIIERNTKISRTNLSVIKSRLTDIIMESLSQLHSKLLSKELRITINEIEILLEKQLYDLPYKKCNSALKKAKVGDNYFIIGELKLIKIQTGLLLKKIHSSNFQDNANALSSIINTLAFSVKAQVSRISLNLNQTLLTEINDSNLIFWISNYQNQKNKGNYILAYNFLSNISVFYHINNDHQNRLEIVNGFIDSFKDDLKLKRKFNTQYLYALNTKLIVSIAINNRASILFCINEFEIFRIVPDNISTNLIGAYLNFNDSLSRYYLKEKKMSILSKP